ncbi:hypothetical protein [Piscibacillus halophilus]|uniref:hypothetical protein n=1 Tax=Piscibacillus halophilus TaxID=571933 RepID=UPI00158CC263|nr:hypothetical protein [Piscibacillus halophilus]
MSKNGVMRIKKWFKKSVILTIVLYITFSPLLTPTILAVSPWSGDSWEGNPWEGTPWDGSSLEWEGETWQGDPWESEGSKGSETSVHGNYDWAIDPRYLEGGAVGDQFGYDGYLGSPDLRPALNVPVDGIDVTPSDNFGSSTESFYEADAFKSAHFATNSLNNIANLSDPNPFGFDGNLSLGKVTNNIVLNSSKLLLGDNDTAVSIYDTGSNGYEMYNSVKELKGLASDYANTGESFSRQSNRNIFKTYTSLLKDSGSKLLNNTDILKAKNTWSNMGALTKFNAGLAGLNSFVSAYKTGESISAFMNLSENAPGTVKTATGADIGANVGETIVSAGGFVMAIPGGQVLGLGVSALGAGIYAASKGVKLFANNWKGDLWSTTKSIGNKATNSVKSAAKKTWDTVSGLFS